MVEQITELLRKYHDLKIRDDSEIFEDNIGNMYIQQGVEQMTMLLVKLNGGELQVEQVPKIDIDMKNLRRVENPSELRGD